jgi:hypothetical protein
MMTLDLHETYSGYYKDPRVDIFYEDYQVMLDSFEAGAGSQPRTLFNLVLDSVNAPQVYAVLAVNNRNEPRIYVLHRPAKIPVQLGRTSPWAGQIFATNGDVIKDRMVTVQFPGDPFVGAQLTRVLPIDATSEYFEAHPDATYLPPVADTTAHSVEVVVRHMMWIPTYLVSDLLLSQGWTPREFWQVNIAKLQEDDKIDECSVFVDWMRVACTAISVRTGSRTSESFAIIKPSLTVPIMDDELFTERNNIVNKDLPGRFSLGLGVNNAILQLADAVAANTTKSVALSKEQSEKTPSKKWPESIGLLFTYQQISDESELPVLYTRLAKASKHETRMVIQSFMTERSNGENAFCTQPLIVNLAIAKCIQDFDYVPGHPDSIGQGLHPFVINNGNMEARERSLRNAQRFDTIEGSSLGLMLQDLDTLLANEVRHIPITFTETEATLGMFGDLLAVVFTPSHALNKAFSAFWKEWMKTKMHLVYVIDQARTYKPVHILRRMQLELYYWFDAVRRKSSPRDLDFTKIIYEIHINAFNPPLLPPNLMAPAEPAFVLVPPEANAMAPLSPAVDAGSTASKSTVIPNPAGPDAVLEQHLTGLHIRDVTIGNGEVPSNNRGNPMCIAFHAKGRCFSKCKRADDHRPHTTAERNKLQAWVQATADKVRAAKQSSPTPNPSA